MLKSRTIQTAILAFLLGGFQGITEYLSPELFLVIEGILTALIIYFRSHPKQTF